LTISSFGTGTNQVTPTTITDVAAGNHQVSVALSGYTTPAAQTVTVVGGQTATADFTLQQTVSRGSIAVTPTPAGATLYLDGRSTGFVTPYTLTNVAAGSHQVTVTKTGYTNPTAQTLTVTAGQTVSASFTLQSATNTGSITVTSSPAGAEIFLDGADTGYTTPYTLTNVATGTHKVQVQKSGYATTVTKSVTVVAGSTASVSFTLTSSSGSIRVTSTPSGATIYLDDVNTGLTTTSTLTNLAPGTHRVRVMMAGYNTPATKTVTVTIGRTVGVTFSLTQAG
jgi:hypothetical protein